MLVTEEGLLNDPSPAVIVKLTGADHGSDVACAGDGREALAELATHPTPDVILLDLAMPVMDGWTFRAEQMRDPHLSQIPVIVISAYRDLSQQVKDLGLIGYLKKPLDLTKLLAIVEQHCCTTQANT